MDKADVFARRMNAIKKARTLEEAHGYFQGARVVAESPMDHEWAARVRDRAVERLTASGVKLGNGGIWFPPLWA